LRRLELQGLASERSMYHTDLLSSSCIDDMLWACQARARVAQSFTGSPRDRPRHLVLPPLLHGGCAPPHQEKELFFCVLVHVAAPVSAWRSNNIRRLTGCSYTSSPPATSLLCTNTALLYACLRPALQVIVFLIRALVDCNCLRPAREPDLGSSCKVLSLVREQRGDGQQSRAS
jgi:hypothetical protein